eukprot:GFUD01010401.1.p1 GENE.GFUD01010401.1~~GFUD01010401.1.p1  ORF type:complete len:140 (+),score=42.71 GFUD01010401.1:138-557(+)
MVSFSICVDLTGNLGEDILSKIRQVIRDSLDLHPEGGHLLLPSLASSLPLPHVMGPTYRYLWVDKIGHSFSIQIETHNEEGGRGVPVLVWAIRRKVGHTLSAICMNTIMGRLKGVAEVKKLGLPKTVEKDMMKAFGRES